jgi:hypothetical protein
MNRQSAMEWTGYLVSIAGLLVLLLTFDRPGWQWHAGALLLILTGLVLIYRSRRHRRRDDSLDDDCGYGLDDLGEMFDGD